MHAFMPWSRTLTHSPDTTNSDLIRSLVTCTHGRRALEPKVAHRTVGHDARQPAAAGMSNCTAPAFRHRPARSLLTCTHAPWALVHSRTETHPRQACLKAITRVRAGLCVHAGSCVHNSMSSLLHLRGHVVSDRHACPCVQADLVKHAGSRVGTPPRGRAARFLHPVLRTHVHAYTRSMHAYLRVIVLWVHTRRHAQELVPLKQVGRISG